MAIDKNSVMSEARKFAAKGLYDKAIAEWKKLLSETPNDANLYNNIGDLCIKKNSRAEAVDAYKRAADILAEDGFTSKAIALYKKILNIDISRTEVHLALGDMHAEKGLTSNALANYKYAADYYIKENKMAEALDIYQKMADLNPTNVSFRIKLADMYAKERMAAEAAKAYLAAADVYLSQDALKEARQLFEKVLSIDPDNKAVYHKAGIVYLKEGKFGEACKALKPAFENDPDNRELSDTYLEALMRAGKDGDAEHLILKILDTDPGRTDLREKLYAVSIARGEFEKALDTASALARSRIEQNDHSGAEEILKRCIADSPRSIPGRRALADLYVSLGRNRDAADTFVQSAKILSEEGDAEGADAALNRALEIVPDLQEARGLLDRLASSVPPSPPAELENERAETPAPELSAGPDQAVEEPAPPALETPAVEELPSAPPALETPDVEELPAAPQAEPVAEVQAVEDEQDDPAVTEALIEADVLVKYGLATKAIEQLERLAQRFPESMQLRVKLRDLHGDQGQMRKAAAHMLVMADLYTKRGIRDQAEEVLRSALDIDPTNTEVSARLGVAPAAVIAGPAAVTRPEPAPPSFEDFAPPADHSEEIAEPAPETASETTAPPQGKTPSSEPAPPSFEDFAPPADHSEEIAGSAPEAAAPQEETPSPEPAPTDEIVIEGLDAGLPQEETEPPVATELPPPDETPLYEPETRSDTSVDSTDLIPEHQALVDDSPPSTGLDASPDEYMSPAFEVPVPEAGTGPLAAEEPAAGAFDMQSSAVEAAPDIEETMPPAEEAPAPPPITEEAEEEPPAPEPAIQEPAAESDVSEIWAEAEFYFQQGLFNEAKKHYARIIELNPGESMAIDRLAEISREEEDTLEFTKLADAVERLEGAPPSEDRAREEMPLSETDEEAVRSLMKEITQLKQPPKKLSPTPSGEEEVVALPPRTAAPPEPPSPPQPPQKGLDATGPATTAGAEEDYFDLGAELAAESEASAPAQLGKQSEDFFDLASELRDELSLEAPAPRAAPSGEQSLDDIFEEFKRGVESQSVKEDADTHYNLGVAYREMGLLDDAISEFIMTTDNEPKFIESRYMRGLCYMEKGEYQNAIGEIQNALDNCATTGEGVHNLIDMHYDLGLAYQGAGNISSALREFQKVQSMDPNYRDVAIKIKELGQGDYISLDQLKDDIEKEISAKFLEEGERIEREEKNRRNEKVRS